MVARQVGPEAPQYGWGGLVARRGRPSVGVGDDDAGRAVPDLAGDAVGGRVLVVLRGLGVDGQEDVGGQGAPGIPVLPLPHFLQRLLLELPRLLLHRQLGLQTRAAHEVRVQAAVESRIQSGVFALLELGLEQFQLPLDGIHHHLAPQGVVHVLPVQPGRQRPAVAAAGAPAAIAANVPAESHVSSVGAQPQPGLSQASPGGREVPQEIPLPLAAAHGLRAAQCAVLVVDGVLDGEGVLVREERDVGLGLGQVVEHAAVGHALAVGGDGARGKVGNEALAVALVQTAAAAAASVIHTAAPVDRMERR